MTNNMMLRVRTDDGQTFTGVDAKEVVRQMRNTQWGAPVLKRDYMIEVAERVSGMTGEPVDTTNVDTFLLSLAYAGVLTMDTYREEPPVDQHDV